MSKETAEELRRALALFGENGEHWVNHPPGKHGEECAVTACSAIATANSRPVLRAALRKAIRVPMFLPDSKVHSLSNYNDTHTWPEIKAMFEKAIAEEEAE